jgi:2-polyprenyl-3-methyl-5-hydroxy-6-metoxy-1,4-benzoquinol methylase
MNPDAILINIKDQALHAYLQRYPFAEGPDRTLNERCFRAVGESIQLRTANEAEQITLWNDEQSSLAPQEQQRVQAVLGRLNLGTTQRTNIYNDFAWRVKPMPRDAGQVLSIGCGSGEELAFIGALIPPCHITAIDFHHTVRPELRTLLNLNFIAADFNELLPRWENRYDVIFCNHVLEHSYDPDRLLAVLRQRLQPGGALIAGLPLDGDQSHVFAREVRQIALNPILLHPIDMNFFDAGHPWKTNAADLKQTLLRSGFRSVAIYQRENHRSRFCAGPYPRFVARRNRAKRLHGAFLHPLRSMLKAAFPKEVPLTPKKIFFGIENRIWFGSNRLKNAFAPDVVAIAST